VSFDYSAMYGNHRNEILTTVCVQFKGKFSFLIDIKMMLNLLSSYDIEERIVFIK